MQSLTKQEGERCHRRRQALQKMVGVSALTAKELGFCHAEVPEHLPPHPYTALPRGQLSSDVKPARNLVLRRMLLGGQDPVIA